MKRIQTAPKARLKLRTPSSSQARVVAASLAGKSNRQIQRETGIARSTVARILSQPEIRTLLAEYHQQALGLVPNALRFLGRALRGRHIDWRMCVEILKGTQVFVSKQDQEITRRRNQFEEWTDEQLDQFLLTGVRPTENPGRA